MPGSLRDRYWTAQRALCYVTKMWDRVTPGRADRARTGQRGQPGDRRRRARPAAPNCHRSGWSPASSGSHRPRSARPGSSGPLRSHPGRRPTRHRGRRAARHRASPVPAGIEPAHLVRARPVDRRTRPGSCCPTSPPPCAGSRRPRPAATSTTRCCPQLEAVLRRPLAVLPRAADHLRRRHGRARPGRLPPAPPGRPGESSRIPCFPPLLDLLDALGVQAQRCRPGRRRDHPGRARQPLLAADARPRSSSSRGPRTRPARRGRPQPPRPSWRQYWLEHRPLSWSRTTRPATSPRTPALSLGSLRPDQTVHIRSFSKSHGPDLRLAALSGPASIVDPLLERRLLGQGWTSRLLQPSYSTC